MSHIRENIFDFIVTDKPQLISDVKISDHFNLNFALKSKAKILKSPKMEVYNYNSIIKLIGLALMLA